MENVKRYGGNIIFSDSNMLSREEITKKVLRDTGAVLVPSSNDARIIRYFKLFEFLMLINIWTSGFNNRLRVKYKVLAKY